MVLPIIVLFNPEKELLKRLLISLKDQVNDICIVDNSPISVKNEIDDILNTIPNKIKYYELNENKGIATAQNIGIQYAQDNNYSHVLLLDQDSGLPDNMIKGLLNAENKLLDKGIKVATVGPVFIDEKTNESVSAIHTKLFYLKRVPVDVNSSEPVVSDYIIASGSLIRISVLKEIGSMVDELFIDWVDIEWGERANHLYGYKSFIIPTVIMRHSIGDETTKSFGRNFNLHSDFRNYFIVRNAVYLMRSKSMSFNSKSLSLIKIPYYIIFYSFMSKRRLYSLGLLAKAAFDGIVSNMGKGHFK
ncbi:glycosyltransferase family 2 protein [Photobacterium andalusiense]|uniref:Glycosyl transferase family 2 n=1 Tax=Photobacterium andalusiense TaxID=2204296 RepID=A0A1Y6MJJ1_9GAMM|nr:glycosyltransferase family 2 protein [Photobacterium andalusiense]SMY35950.1 Glycosyl transferase family 2 [Photobacterium andalusiense]